MAILF